MPIVLVWMQCSHESPRFLSRDVIANDGDTISTRRRSFVGLCEAMPTIRRFPPPWTVEGSSRRVFRREGQRRPKACLRLFVD